MANLRLGHLPLNVSIKCLSPSDPPVVFSEVLHTGYSAGIQNSRRLEDREGDETGADPPSQNPSPPLVSFCSSECAASNYCLSLLPPPIPPS